jgi:hypothetical protein
MAGKISGLKLARGLALTAMLAAICIFFIGALEFPRFAAGHMNQSVPYAPAWTPTSFEQILAQFGLSLKDWQYIRFSTSIFVAMVFCTVGLLVFYRKRDDWFGIYIGLVFVLFSTLNSELAAAFVTFHPNFTWLLTPLGVLSWWGLFQLLFLFPNGRYLPAWTRWIANLLLLLYIISVAGFGTGTPPAPIVVAILALFSVGAVSQVYRYHKISTTMERQQTKWIMSAMVFVFCGLLVSTIPMLIPQMLIPGSPGNMFALFFGHIPSYFIVLIPLSFAFAIFRYRLWDIDVIIRRTLLYTGLSATLGLVYFGSVLLFQQLLGPLTGNSTLAIVLSTLLIAALFDSARRKIQSFVDRRFYRQKYNAALALEDFSEAARREVELSRLTSLMISVAEKTVQPEQVSVWMREKRINR